MMENEDYYVVKKGDTLESIALEFLGDANLSPLLKQINTVPDGELRDGLVLLLHPIGLEQESSASK